ncbi:hypothetical protein JL721_9142 [Aureococcus anophagefferens]|nr:hypothetical protein JL721_9142 [Aureococcus anophagefferens]
MSLRAAKTLAAVAAGAAHHTVAFDGGDAPAALASEVVEDDAAAHDVRALVPELLKRALRRDATAMAALRARGEMARRALAIGAKLARDPAVRRSAVRRCRAASGKERELIAEAVASSPRSSRSSGARSLATATTRGAEAAPPLKGPGPLGRLGSARRRARRRAHRLRRRGDPGARAQALRAGRGPRRARPASLAILSGALGERARE